MGWGSQGAGRKADAIAQDSENPTDRLLAILIEQIAGLRQDLADERKATEARRVQESRHARS